MMDVFVMIISIVAFRVTIRSPEYSFLTPNFYKIDLLVAPLWGLYANLTAQLVTQFSSHAIINYHRKAAASGLSAYLRRKETGITDGSLDSLGNVEKEVAPEQNVQKALCNSEFLRQDKDMTETLYLRTSANFLIVICSTLLFALLLIGFLLPSFSFENLGIVGVAIEFGQNFEDARQEFSIASIVQLLMEQGRFLGTAKDTLGHLSIGVLLIASTLVIPYLLIVLLLFQFWYPLERSARKRIDTIVEGLSAWQYVDVYLLSVVVATWQVGDISEYLVNPYCGSLDRTFSELVWYGILDEDDAQCFKVRSQIEPVMYTLVAAAVLLSLLMSFVTNANKQIEYQGDLVARSLTHNVTDHDHTELDDDALCEKIHPAPVLLTNRFRWLFHTRE